MRGFLRQHGKFTGGVPRERVVVFDEAQRAWDRDQVLTHHQGQLVGSEPELLTRIGGRAEDGFVIVALIGHGQESTAAKREVSSSGSTLSVRLKDGALLVHLTSLGHSRPRESPTRK